MSAGIILLNKNGLAAAADSAVTLGDRSAIFNTAQKIFAIGNSSVLLLYTGSATFQGVPVDLIFKQFSLHCQKYNIARGALKDYAEEFIRFIDQRAKLFLFPKNEYSVYYNYVCEVVDEVMARTRHVSKEEIASQDFFKKICDEIIEFNSNTNLLELNRAFSWKDCLEKYPDIIKNGYEDYMLNYCERDLIAKPLNEIDQETIEQITRVAAVSTRLVYYFRKRELNVCFAGFGEEAIYPSLYNISFYGFIDSEILSLELDDFSISDDAPRNIKTLAQDDVINSVLDGYNQQLKNAVNENYEAKIRLYMEENLKTVNIENFDYNKFVDGLVQSVIIDCSWSDVFDEWRKSWAVIEHLSTIDLSILAKNLINIQSVKRKYEADVQNNSTVGGPTVVATITKSDGFKLVSFDKE